MTQSPTYYIAPDWSTGSKDALMKLILADHMKLHGHIAFALPSTQRWAADNGYVTEDMRVLTKRGEKWVEVGQ
jgi:hypothetical protein